MTWLLGPYWLYKLWLILTAIMYTLSTVKGWHFICDIINLLGACKGLYFYHKRYWGPFP